jgi:hypothetical protein
MCVKCPAFVCGWECTVVSLLSCVLLATECSCQEPINLQSDTHVFVCMYTCSVSVSVMYIDGKYGLCVGLKNVLQLYSGIPALVCAANYRM